MQRLAMILGSRYGNCKTRFKVIRSYKKDSFWMVNIHISSIFSLVGQISNRISVKSSLNAILDNLIA